MNMVTVSLVILHFVSLSLYGMEAPAPKTLYEYFGLSSRFQENGLNDIKKQLTKEIMKGKECWHVKTTLGDSATSSDKVVYSSDGALVAALCSDKALRIWDQEGKNTVTQHYSCALTGLVACPNEPFLFLSRADNVLQKVTLQGKTIKRVYSEISKVMAINADGSELFTMVGDSIENNGYRSIYDPKVWSNELTIKRELAPMSDICAAAFYPLEHRWDIISVKATEGYYKFARERFGQMQDTIGHVSTRQRISCFAVDSKGHYHVAGSSQGVIELFDSDLRTIDTYALGDSPIQALVFDANNAHILAGLASSVFIVEVPFSYAQRVKLVQRGLVLALALHNFGAYEQLAVACKDAPIALWQHKQLTFEQMLLRLILKEYLTRCILERTTPKCPSPEQQNSDQDFIFWMAGAFNLNKESIFTVWQTFDEYLRRSIIRTYVHRVDEIIMLPQRIAERVARDAEEIAIKAALVSHMDRY